jgi:isopentenyl-diphosphate Delta-isomerase
MTPNFMVNPYNPEAIIDPNASSRKKDHIALAFRSRVTAGMMDERFSYESAISGHPAGSALPVTPFLGFSFRIPVWVSSMTGGTEHATTINSNLARACGEFGMGMGLGSCRQLLYSNDHLKDFSVKKFMPDQPLFANLGIAQLEQLVQDNLYRKISELVSKLDADGLIVHINPMQEWLQPEGDRYYKSPVETIQRMLDKTNIPVIVKEVGQGMGPESLSALMQLPLAAVDFAASGGTNFALLELLRSSEMYRDALACLANVGHGAVEMLDIVNDLQGTIPDKLLCKQIIISGGINNFLDGYYLISKSKIPAVYGQASAFLKYATGDYDTLRQYVDTQKHGLEMAYTFLKIK